MEKRQKILSRFSDAEVAELNYSWNFWARPNQLPPPGDWSNWLILAGRGWGKTRTGAEFIRRCAESGQVGRIALVAETSADARDVMVEGQSGILAISNPRFRPEYLPSKRKLIWPNGCTAYTYSADEPGQLRGPQFEAAWCDELAKWHYEMAWDNLQFGMRLGKNPRTCITTTPVPSKIIKALARDPQTHVTSGSTYENKNNLAPKFINTIIKKYEGTRLGRQELHAEILEDNPNALWNMPLLDGLRASELPSFKRIVIAIDPAVSMTDDSDETGIIVAGVGADDTGYVLQDLSGRYKPDDWAKIVCEAYQKWQADLVIAETNQGGDLVKSNLHTRDRNIPYKGIHARKGKFLRAEPVSSLYEQKRVKHYGMFSQLESQMCDYTPGSAKSPDRLDALVYAITELMLKEFEWIFQ